MISRAEYEWLKGEDLNRFSNKDKLFTKCINLPGVKRASFKRIVQDIRQMLIDEYESRNPIE